jgi:hypothetical protein
METDEASVLCLGCGLAMALRPGIPVCSLACRQRERRARRRRSRRAFCADCGGVFVPRRSDAQYCGLSCKERAHRRRKASEAEASKRAREAPWAASEPLRPPSPGKPPEAAPAPVVGPRHPRTGRVIDIASLIG